MSVNVKSFKKMKSKYNWRHRIELLQSLGEGTYGKVKLAVDRKTGEKMAIKYIMKKKISTEQDLQRVRREIEIMASLSHEHIVQIYEVFENKEKFVIMMEYIDGGELYDYVNARGVLNDADARRIFRQVVSAVHHLHQAGVVHRDLKLENILLDSNGNVKLADFGLSNRWQHNRFLHTFCGSPLYASPEIVNGRPYYGPEVDCWSLGVLLYTLVYGTMPFDGTNFERLRSQITRGDYYEPTKPSDAASLIRRLLTVNPAKRASVADVCRHWWTNVDCNRSLWHEVQEAKAESQADKRTSDYFEDDSLFLEHDQLSRAAAAGGDKMSPAQQQPHTECTAAGAQPWVAAGCRASSPAAADKGSTQPSRGPTQGRKIAAKCSSGDSGCGLADPCLVAADVTVEEPAAHRGTSTTSSRYSMADIEAVLDALGSADQAHFGNNACANAASPAAAAADTAGAVGPISLADSGASPGSRRRSISVLHGSITGQRDATAEFAADSRLGHSVGDTDEDDDCGSVAVTQLVPERGRSASLNAPKLIRCVAGDGSDKKQCNDGGSVSSLSSCGNLLDFDMSDGSSDDHSASASEHATADG